jgi:hypothetical protein
VLSGTARWSILTNSIYASKGGGDAGHDEVVTVRHRIATRRVALWGLVAFVVTLAAIIGAALASAAGPTSLSCDQTSIQAALTAGGNYQFTCTFVDLTSTLTSGQATTLEAPTGKTVTFYQQYNQLPTWQVFDVTGGSLTLTGIELDGGDVWSAGGSAGAPGAAGAQGATGASFSGTGQADAGGTGGDGSPGSPGSTGTPAEGGGIYVGSGATVTLNGGGLENQQVIGGGGGSGGAGGGGGRGGFGGQCNSGVCTGGDGGDAGDGSNGATGGTGGVGQGGGVYVAAGGTLNVSGGTVFQSNLAEGGGGGAGGGGGMGGEGGQSGLGTDGTNGNAGAAGQPGTAAAGGQGGAGEGGAIYNAGTLNISDAVFTSDHAAGGGGGTGGSGGGGGYGGIDFTGVGTNGVDGGSAANGGPPGATGGGAIYNAGTMTLGQGTFTTDAAYGGGGGGGGQGGAGGQAGTAGSPTPGTNGAGGNGVTGGEADFASVYSATAIVGCASFSGDTVSAGGGGAAGGGGYNQGISPTGPAGSAGVAGTTGTVDPTIVGGTTCPTVSVADSSAAEPTDGDGTLTFSVTLSAAQSQPVTVDYETADGSAKAGTDYDADSGTLTFPAGQTVETVPVTIDDVGDEPDKTFTVTLTDPTPAKVSIGRGTATGTIHGTSPLSVTESITPADTIVQQTATGPVPVSVTDTVTLKNTGTEPITDATLPSELTIGWHAPANGATVPVKQTAAPAPTKLDLGTLAPGQSMSGSYTLQVSGDGSLDVEALGTGAFEGGTITGFGTTVYAPDSQLLVFTAKLGAVVHSQQNPTLVQAGTSFLVNLTLENRSDYRSIVVDPIYPDLDGNASDGDVLPASVSNTSANPNGSLNEVDPSPYILLKPGEVEHYLVVVRTGASDAQDTETAVSGGTRATVSFDTPTINIVNADGNSAAAVNDDDHVLVVPGSDSIDVHLDDSGFQAPPPAGLAASAAYAAWDASKGVVWGLWRVTYGTVRGLLWDLPTLALKGVANVSTASLDYVDHMVELWTACDNNAACLDNFEEQVLDKVEQTVVQAPFMLTQSLSQVKQTVDQSVLDYFRNLVVDWDAGDWHAALTEGTAGATDAIANVALMLGPSILARSSKAAAAWEAAKTATYAKVGDTLAATARALEPAKAAVLALSDVVKPGFWFTEEQMASIFGVSDRESSLLSALTKRLGISVVLRSRASEAIKFLEDGVAVMKPYWIKTKNVSWLDTQALGYPDSQIGKVVIRPPVSLEQVENNMLKHGFERDSVQWQEGLARRLTRIKEYNGELKQMQKWNKAGKVRGKWPWAENGVNPAVQADEYSTVNFRLNTQDGSLVPEIFSEGKWKFITGDIDLIAITKANGTALSDAEHVAVLKQLSTVLGTQHPESATWINDGKFWFKAKENYLTNDGECCMAQYGPDGKIRAVEFNQKLSDPTSWTKLNYRIFWNGGYQAGATG